MELKEIQKSIKEYYENDESKNEKNNIDTDDENDEEDSNKIIEEDQLNENKDDITEGYLYKIQANKMKKIYFRLICKDLYYYKSKPKKQINNKSKVKSTKKNSPKNKNNNDKSNYNNKRIDISKELTPKLLREINRGKWIEKKEGI